MKKLNCIIVLLVAIIALSGCVVQPILNMDGVNITSTPEGAQPSLDTVQKAIIKACQDRGWVPTVKEKGVIDASLRERGFLAEISIKFDTTQYSINYISSQNLDYSVGKINRNYNRWISLLSSSIQRELGVYTRGL
jgi:hypothetical protein